MIQSDTCLLNGLVAALLEVTSDIHVLRDPTRGGLASTLNEIAQASGVGIAFDRRKLPRDGAGAVRLRNMLGLDPLYVANEGKLAAIVPPESAEAILAAMLAHPLGRDAVIIGSVTAENPGVVTARTGIGATRLVDMQVGEQLPRIC